MEFGRASIPPGKRGGDKRTVIMREVVNGLMYILSTGCQWRAIPKDLPPRSTLYDYFDLWNGYGTLDLIHHELYVKCREAVAKEASPTAAVIDSQSVKSAEKGGPRLIRRYDAGKKIKGKKRHILVDTQGLLIHAIVHVVDIQDRDGGASSWRSSACIRSCWNSTPMAAIKARCSATPSRKYWHA